ncbi:hypothetical protein RB195_016851 [Necator americanus]|uniref:Core-2/I-Branching enzyme n=1 Tax=Necator americanus TaxID=51031 RepID=A0ABR1C2G3_NECAM
MSISQEQLQAIIFYQWGRGTAVNIDSTLRKDTTTIRTVYLLFACFAKENMIFDEKSRIRSTSPHRVILDVAKEQVLSYRRSADSMNPSYLHGWHAVHPVIHLSNSSPSVSKDLVKEDLVTVDKKEFDVTAGGYNMNKAHYMCMRMLLKEKGWEYVLLLQNHDVIIKSPYEMVEIYSLLGGANDVHVSRCPEELCSPEMKWTPRSLKLFLNESGTSSKTLDTTIELAKGAVQVSLSRAAVQWLIDTVNLTTILEKLNKKTYGYDEIMMASLQVNEELGMPGRFTSDCLSQVTTSNGVERIADIRTATVICWFPRNQSAISALKRQSRREKSRAGSESRKAALIGFEYFGFDHCLNDEQLINEEFNVDEYGHYMNHAHYACMQLLLQKQGWEYILLLQNHDVIIKSPYEMVEIYKLLDGANDVEISLPPEDRWDHNKSWDALSLHLFRNESEMSSSQLNATIKFAKGAVQASLSRAAVDWLVNIANLTTLINQLNEKPFGVDEILIESLQISDELDMPGRFTSECLMNGIQTPSVTRLSLWIYGTNELCKSQYARKSICIFGIEDLQSLSQYPHLMANKV